MGKPKVAAVIQARMGSTRFPGKVLYSVAGMPVLGHIIHRLRKSRMLDVIAIATSDQPCDDPLVEFARSQGVELVRGPEDNVLQRFALAAEQIDPDVILRVTGDAPMVDPGTVDRLVETLLREGAEYCTGEKGVHAIHEGFCPFTRAALNRLLAEASDDPVAIEHVTAYFVAHPDDFHIARISIPPEHQFRGARVSVDTPADVRFIEEVYQRLGVPAGEADMSEVVTLLRNHPELLEINGHIYQKKATDRSFRVLMRCDGDSRIGMGHVVRCLALADELRETHGCGVTFAMGIGEPGRSKVLEAGFPILTMPADANEDAWMDDLMGHYRADILVLDLRSDLGPEKVRAWREAGVLVATVDDPGPRRLQADLAFYPPVPQVREHCWKDFSGELHIGWEWVVLRSEFAETLFPKKPNPPRLLVTMGGSDPAGLTLKAVRALDQTPGDFIPQVVLGCGFCHREELTVLLQNTRRNFEVFEDVQDMASLMASSSFAVASFGVTAYELASMGVPALLLCLSDDHARSAEAFVEAGIARSLGLHSGLEQTALTQEVTAFLADGDQLARMSCRGRDLVDGAGAGRIAQLLLGKMGR